MIRRIENAVHVFQARLEALQSDAVKGRQQRCRQGAVGAQHMCLMGGRFYPPNADP